MELDGLPTVYSDQVTYLIAGDPLAPQAPLRANLMLLFATAGDANQILPLANAACGSACELAGGTGPLTVTVTQVGTVVANNDPCYATGPSATFCYHTADGPRPYQLKNAAHHLAQYVSDLVAKHTPDKSGLKLTQDAGGAAILVWV